MAKRIYTYRLMKRDRQVLPLPIDAQILCLQEQFGEAHVSVMLEADEPAKYKPRTIVS
ncbi:hypothetical protein NBG4_250034 [Candidatus Sulfobium mesophilum]|uniref:Uncharacterized protein n=1 Tax=Candidatus Sulfobium mesophilum TaxID=2016548 RepID=A0A2U3QGH5_9BACT|nr:hypothetical protein NBG4_250034 [Candidatus Sulfobium mesophilum]